MRYRKLPVEINAMKWDGKLESFYIFLEEIQQWGSEIRVIEDSLIIRTLEGNQECRPGDWLICGVKGELYSCKDDIFQATYEAVGNL